MKNLIVVGLMLTFVGCAGIPAQRVKVVNLPKKGLTNKASTRQEKYFNCVKELNREGIKQALIKELCNATFGSIE